MKMRGADSLVTPLSPFHTGRDCQLSYESGRAKSEGIVRRLML